MTIRAEVVHRECRRRLWSKTELARVASLHVSTLRHWPEEGQVRVHRTTADRIARAFEENPVRDMVDLLLGEAAGQ